MPSLRLASALLVFSLSCAVADADETQPSPTADAIMARVAANQDRAEEERAHYVYVQHAKVVSRRGNTVMCDEITDYRVTPSNSGSRETLLKLDGRILQNHKYAAYNALRPKEDKAKGNDDHDAVSVTIGDDSLDRDLVENMRENLMHDQSRDGLDARLFPLTTKAQADYTFHLAARERMNGRDVFHVVFRPKNKNDFGWKGDAWIDTTAFQPVLVTTDMARKIPFAVRTFLGTNLPGLGFSVAYAPQPDGVWFPVTFSTEFKIHVLFFFRREVIINAQNREFEKTHVTSRIVGEGTPVDQHP